MDITRLGRTFSKYRFSITFVLILVFIAIWIINMLMLDSTNCARIKKLNQKSGVSSSFDNSYQLRDYYVKTAYNACASGQFKNDYMNICALENVIKQGARCIDFQIYSLDDEPVIAASSVTDYNIKETYNSVKFRDALTTISENALGAQPPGICPNPDDPIILHLRIMSNNKKMYDKMAALIVEIMSDKLLEPSYNYKLNPNIIGETILYNLNGKVVIIVDNSNSLFESTKLDELVNLTSISGLSMRSLRYVTDVKYCADPDELITYNKDNMTIVIPELSISSSNHNAQLAWDYGCQFVAMCFQNSDNNMDNYNVFFYDKGAAFVLKDKHLRTIQQTAQELAAAAAAADLAAGAAAATYTYVPKTSRSTHGSSQLYTLEI